MATSSLSSDSSIARSPRREQGLLACRTKDSWLLVLPVGSTAEAVGNLLPTVRHHTGLIGSSDRLSMPDSDRPSCLRQASRIPIPVTDIRCGRSPNRDPWDSN